MTKTRIFLIDSLWCTKRPQRFCWESGFYLIDVVNAIKHCETNAENHQLAGVQKFQLNWIHPILTYQSFVKTVSEGVTSCPATSGIEWNTKTRWEIFFRYFVKYDEQWKIKIVIWLKKERNKNKKKRIHGHTNRES